MLCARGKIRRINARREFSAKFRILNVAFALVHSNPSVNTDLGQEPSLRIARELLECHRSTKLSQINLTVTSQWRTVLSIAVFG